MSLTKLLPLYDIHQAAFLEFKGTPLILTRQGSRVVFEVPANEETYRLLREYQDNNLIPLLDYVAVLRRLRARMLEACDGNGRRGRERGGYDGVGEETVGDTQNCPKSDIVGQACGGMRMDPCIDFPV